MSPPALELIEVSRSFPGVQAMDRVTFSLQPGEVHAIVGENGAGKSTLINVVSGVLKPDSGSIRLKNAEVQLRDPVDVRSRGIVTVHQEAELFPTLSVAENMALTTGLPLSHGVVDWKAIEQTAREAVRHVGETIDVNAPAAQLSVAHRHMTHVAAAVLQQARVLVLDEPTSALSEVEAQWLFEQINRLRASGAGIIYVSHRQDEIFHLADRITVLRDGKHVWTGATHAISPGELIERMVGRVSDPFPNARNTDKSQRVGKLPDKCRLRCSHLSDSFGRFTDVSVDVHAGEIVGVYGLVGSGRTEFAEAVFGLRPASSGDILLDAQRLKARSPMDAVKAGIAYVPEDRLRQGVFGGLSLRANSVMASLQQWARGPFATASAERAATTRQIEQLSVRCRSVEQPITELSGGNQQKVVLGRWLLTEPKVLILDEPTRGVDVGTKPEIHGLLRTAADGGCGVLMISSDLPEVLAHSDRVIVLRNGRVAGQFDPTTASAEDIASAAIPHDSEDMPVGWLKGQGGVRPSSSRDAAESCGSSVWRTTSARFVSSFWRPETALLAVVLILAVWLGVGSEEFRLTDLATHASIWIVLGLAAACTILAGGIDISIGSLVGLSAAVTALTLKSTLPEVVSIPLAVLAGVATGALGGLLNAAIALAGRVHPIVVTLGTLTVFRGIVIILLSGKAMTGLPDAFGHLAVHPASGMRGLILVAAVVVVALAFWLRCCRSGRHVYAIGSSRSASRLCGISQTRTWLLAFSVSGGLAGLAGVMTLAHTQQMQARLGAGWELSAIAIAVIGGVSITGGRGTVFGVVLGAILLRLVNSALVRWGIPDAQVDLFTGGMLLAAVLVDLAWRRRLSL